MLNTHWFGFLNCIFSHQSITFPQTCLSGESKFYHFSAVEIEQYFHFHSTLHEILKLSPEV